MAIRTTPQRSINQQFFNLAARVPRGFIVALTLAILAMSVTAQTASTPPAPNSSAPPKPAPTQSGPAPHRIGDFIISGSIRTRFESWDWFDTSAADGNYNFLGSILRLGIGQQKAKYDWQIEVAVPILLGVPDNAIASAPQGQLGLGASYYAANGDRHVGLLLKQGYLRLKALGGDEAGSLRLGRFEFADGAETTPKDATLAALKRDRIAHRLLGNFGFSHVGRSFDGIQYARQTVNSNFTFLAARPTEGVLQLNGMNELDTDVFYGAYTRPIKAQAEFRVFALHYHDGRRVLKSDNRTAAVRAADQENIRLTTFGGHYLQTFKASPGQMDVLFWGVGQAGQWGRLDHRAGAVAAEIGYQPKLKLKPWMRAGYFRGSGDGDPNDGQHNTFFQVLPTPRIYARFPFYNLMNNEDAFAQLTLRPHARVTLRTDAHHLRLSSKNDLWYQGGGAFQNGTFGFSGRTSGGQRNLATLLDGSVDLQLSPRTSLTFYLAGGFGHGVVSNIYPAGQNARLSYIEITRRF